MSGIRALYLGQDVIGVDQITAVGLCEAALECSFEGSALLWRHRAGSGIVETRAELRCLGWIDRFIRGGPPVAHVSTVA